MKPPIKSRPPAPDTPPADLRELMTLIGQVPPELENFLLDRRVKEPETGR